MDFNSKYKSSEIERILDSVGGKQDAITDLEVIREGASKGATAVQPSDIPEETYLADFTMFSLRQGIDNGSQVNCDINSLIEAMAANKTILVRDDEGSYGYKGVYVLNGYAEDLLYFSIVDSQGDVLYCEGTDYTNNDYIDGRTLHVRRWDDKQDALVSGKNIKTINGESIFGSGDITVSGGGSSSGSGKEYIVVEPDLSPAGSEAYIHNIVPNTTYLVSEAVSLLHINNFSISDALSDEYNVIFKADIGETTLSIIYPYGSIYWANGVIPTIDGGAVYELSIQRVRLGAQDFFNAVLTPFKLIE